MKNSKEFYCDETCKHLVIKKNFNYCKYYKTKLEGNKIKSERCYACRNRKETI